MKYWRVTFWLAIEHGRAIVEINGVKRRQPLLLNSHLKQTWTHVVMCMCVTMYSTHGWSLKTTIAFPPPSPLFCSCYSNSIPDWFCFCLVALLQLYTDLEVHKHQRRADAQECQHLLLMNLFPTYVVDYPIIMAWLILWIERKGANVVVFSKKLPSCKCPKPIMIGHLADFIR